MQQHNTTAHMIDDDSLFFTPKRKSPRVRKWREIEAIISRHRLNKELREIDQSFTFSMDDLI